MHGYCIYFKYVSHPFVRPFLLGNDLGSSAHLDLFGLPQAIADYSLHLLPGKKAVREPRCEQRRNKLYQAS